MKAVMPEEVKRVSSYTEGLFNIFVKVDSERGVDWIRNYALI